MPISESMVQDIVQEVMAKMQIADAPAGKHGIIMAVRIAGWNTKHQTRNCFSCHADFCCVCASASSYALLLFNSAFFCYFLCQ